MNDFPELTPPPERNLTAAQRTRILGRLAQADEQHEDLASRPWWITGGAAAAAVLIVVGGAFALSRTVGNEEPPVQPAETSTAQPVTNPIPFETGGDGETCLGEAPRTVVVYDQVTPLRDVILTGASLESASGATLGRAWVALIPPGTVSSGGSFQEGQPGLSRAAGWQDRRQLTGAVLEKGQTYSLFVRVTMEVGGRLQGFTFDYSEAGSAGTSTLVGTVRAEKKC